MSVGELLEELLQRADYNWQVELRWADLPLALAYVTVTPGLVVLAGVRAEGSE